MVATCRPEGRYAKLLLTRGNAHLSRLRWSKRRGVPALDFIQAHLPRCANASLTVQPVRRALLRTHLLRTGTAN